MGFAARLLRVEGRLPWGIIGSLIGIIGIVVGVYYTIREPVSQLVLDVMNEVNVLDVRQPVRDLTIAFRGEDVQQANLNLRVFTARLENVGAVDILQSHYDKEDTWGIQVANGKLIEARLVDSNSSYVRARLNPRIVGENLLTLTKVILERGKHFTLELLVLHPKEARPTLAMIGKIAGFEAVPVKRSWLEREQPSTWTHALVGHLKVQLARVLIYGGGAVIGLVAIFVAALFLEHKMTIAKHTRRRRRAAAILKELEVDEKQAEALADAYHLGGLEGLKALRKGLDDTEVLLDAVQAHERMEAARQAARHRPLRERPTEKDTRALQSQRARYTAGPLIEAGLVQRAGERQVTVAAELPSALDALLDRLSKAHEES